MLITGKEPCKFIRGFDAVKEALATILTKKKYALEIGK
jgi:hypothetical protein